MSWLQLELETNQVFGEELSVLLEEFGAISISLTASSDEPIFDEDAENNTLWDKTKLTALLNSKCDVDSLLIKLHKNLGSDAIHSHKIKFLKDKDWIHEFKSKYQPIFFLNNIYNSNLIKFYINSYLQNADLENACNIFNEINFYEESDLEICNSGLNVKVESNVGEVKLNIKSTKKKGFFE